LKIKIYGEVTAIKSSLQETRNFKISVSVMFDLTESIGRRFCVMENLVEYLCVFFKKRIIEGSVLNVKRKDLYIEDGDLISRCEIDEDRRRCTNC